MSINAFSDVAITPHASSADRLGDFAALTAGDCRERIIAASGVLGRRCFGRRTRGLSARMPAAREITAQRWQATVADYLDQHPVAEDRLREVAWYVETAALAQGVSLRDVLDLLAEPADRP